MYVQVGKLIGQKWRELSDDDKQPYFEEYEAEKAVYVEQLKRYKNSPAYKKWMEAKAQGNVLHSPSHASFKTGVDCSLIARLPLMSRLPSKGIQMRFGVLEQ